MQLLQNGNTFTINNPVGGTVVDSLGGGIFEAVFGTHDITFIRVADKFDVPEKLFGVEAARRIRLIGREWAASEESKDSVTAILVGQKGSGKTLLAKTVANLAIEKSDLPVIVVASYIPAVALLAINSVIKECVFLFDEYEKNYGKSAAAGSNDPSRAEEMLTFFSERRRYRSLNLITSNSVDGIDKFMIDRPGRAAFLMRYDGLTASERADAIQHYGITGPVAKFIDQYASMSGVNLDTLKFVCDRALAAMKYFVDESGEVDFDEFSASFRDDLLEYNVPMPCANIRYVTIEDIPSDKVATAKYKMVTNEDGKAGVKLTLNDATHEVYNDCRIEFGPDTIDFDFNHSGFEYIGSHTPKFAIIIESNDKCTIYNEDRKPIVEGTSALKK